MASTAAVQSYLQKHKIGPLFEDLMAKVISDMPDEPLAYLGRILNLRAERKSGIKTTTGTKKTLSSSGKTDPLNRSGGKKTVAIASRPDWDGRTATKKPPVAYGSGLDDIWGEQPKATRKSQESRGVRSGASAWHDSEDGEDVLFSAYGYSGPRRRKGSDDLLMGEIGLMRDPGSASRTDAPVSHKKRSQRKNNSYQHKASLEKYIKSSKQQKGRDSGFEDSLADDDDAIELLEDDADLRNEGVLNAKKSGVRLSRSTRYGSTRPSVKVSICARCANIMGGGQPSEPARELMDRTPMTTARSERAPTEPSQSPFHVVASDDDEFESVSQVTGPRKPVWQNANQRAVTPRKGKSMLASNMSPTKGLPMYSSTGKANRGAFQSEDFTGSPEEADNPLSKTWSPDAYAKAAEDESAVEDNRSAWQVPPDYDTDSSFYGSPGGGKLKSYDRAY